MVLSGTSTRTLEDSAGASMMLAVFGHLQKSVQMSENG